LLTEIVGRLQALAEKDMGDFIIHPSSKGPAHLSIALKLPDGLFSHIDIAEGGKDNWDLASFLRLVKTLTIGDDSYQNLDEVHFTITCYAIRYF
jgi:transcription elongation factor SPT6